MSRFIIKYFTLIYWGVIALVLIIFSNCCNSKTVYEYNKYGIKTGYYIQNSNVTTYYNKYGSKQYQYKNGKVYDKYGKFVKRYR